MKPGAALRLGVLAMLVAQNGAETRADGSTDGAGGGELVPSRDEPLFAEGIVSYTAYLPKTVFEPGRAIPLSLEFTNRTGRALTVWSCGFSPNHRLLVTDQEGVEPPLTERGRRSRERFDPAGARDTNLRREVEDGHSLWDELGLDLTRAYTLAPGRYRVRVTYEDPTPPTPLRIACEAIDFEVSGEVPAAREEGPAYRQGEPLALTAYLPRAVYGRGQSIPFSWIELRNPSRHPVTIRPGGLWENFKVIVTDERGDEPALTAQGQEVRAAFAGVGRAVDEPRALAGGVSEHISGYPALNDLYRLDRGRYTVHLIYSDHQEPNPVRATSEATSFEVR